ncbi:hypothetical protein REPUB_Repub18cG0159600 [Reevesia pubescens]
MWLPAGLEFPSYKTASVNEREKLQQVGSRPPTCVNKCFSCRPCMATLVIHPHGERKRYRTISRHDEELGCGRLCSQDPIKPLSLTGSPVNKIQRTSSDDNMRDNAIRKGQKLPVSPMESPSSVKEDGTHDHFSFPTLSLAADGGYVGGWEGLWWRLGTRETKNG